MRMIDKKLIQNLSVEEKRAVVELLRKKDMIRRESSLESFVPNPGAQTDFLKSKARIRAMFGGNSLGKTSSMVIELLYHHTGMHPHRDVSNTHHTWLVIPTARKAEDYWIEIQKWCPPSMLPKSDRMGTSDIKRFRFKNGSICTIFSHDQDLAVFESTNISGAFFDEPPPRNIYVAVYRGLRANPDWFICIAATPLSDPWMYEQIYIPGSTGANKDIEIFEGSTYENKHIPTSWIESFRNSLTEDEIKTRIYGKFGMLQGRVFSQFKLEDHVIPEQIWPADWPVYLAVDPHPKKPHALLAIGVTPDDNYVAIDEHFETGEISELAETIKKWEKKYLVDSTIIDNSGSSLDWTRQSAVQILADNGILVTPVRRSDKDVSGGINRIKQLLKGTKDRQGNWTPQLKVMANCKGLIREFSLYTWAVPKNPERGDAEKVVKTNDELLDCLRYIVNRTPQYQNELEFSSYIDNKNPYKLK